MESITPNTDRRYFSISGYWKDDKSEFSGYIVTDYDDSESEGDDGEMNDDEVFFYGLSEKDIKQAIEMKEDTMLGFVITEYTPIN